MFKDEPLSTSSCPQAPKSGIAQLAKVCPKPDNSIAIEIDDPEDAELDSGTCKLLEIPNSRQSKRVGIAQDEIKMHSKLQRCSSVCLYHILL